jgi:hypothetical protein
MTRTLQIKILFLYVNICHHLKRPSLSMAAIMDGGRAGRVQTSCLLVVTGLLVNMVATSAHTQ